MSPIEIYIWFSSIIMVLYCNCHVTKNPQRFQPAHTCTCHDVGNYKKCCKMAAISRTEIKRGGVLMETPAKSTTSAQFPSQIALFLNARHKHTRHQARRLMKVQWRERRARRAFISPRFSEFFSFFCARTATCRPLLLDLIIFSQVFGVRLT